MDAHEFWRYVVAIFGLAGITGEIYGWKQFVKFKITPEIFILSAYAITYIIGNYFLWKPKINSISGEL